MKKMCNYLKYQFDKSFSGKFWKQIVFLATLSIFITFIVWFGFSFFFPAKESLVKAVGYLFDSNAFHHDTKEYLEGNHINPIFSAFITFIGMVLMGGILISIITNRLERRVDRIKGGSILYSFTNHTIILGYDETVPSLIKQISKEDAKTNIVLLTTLDAQKVRQKLHTQLDKNEEKKVVVIHSRRDSREVLVKINILHAKIVYLLGEKEEFDHDAININCLSTIAKIIKKENCNRRLTCVTSLQYQSTFVLFQSTDISQEIKTHIDFRPFNFCKVWARKVFVTGESTQNNITYKPLDYEPITENSSKTVHLVVAGMTNMGIALAIKAAHIAHYPNFIHDKSKKTKITLIDQNAKEEMEFMIGRYRQLFNFCKYTYADYSINDPMKKGEVNILKNPTGEDDFINLEWEFIQGNISDFDIQSKIRDWSDAKNNTLLTIGVCFNNSTKNIATGLYFDNELYERNIPILIYQKTSGELFKMLNNSKYDNVYPFGMSNDGYDTMVYSFDRAKKINYVYDYFHENGSCPDYYPLELMEEKWQKLSVAKKWSNIYNESTISSKLCSIGIDHKNVFSSRELTNHEIAILAEVEHNRWNVEELILGFRPATKEEKEIIKAKVDPLKRDYKNSFIHYDIRPYNDLQIDESGENANRFDIALTKGLISIVKSDNV